MDWIPKRRFVENFTGQSTLKRVILMGVSGKPDNQI
jgi:hypothetical protein